MANISRIRRQSGRPSLSDDVIPRVGALAFAAGLGLAVATGSGVAAAAPQDSGSAGASSESAGSPPPSASQGGEPSGGTAAPNGASRAVETGPVSVVSPAGAATPAAPRGRNEDAGQTGSDSTAINDIDPADIAESVGEVDDAESVRDVDDAVAATTSTTSRASVSTRGRATGPASRRPSTIPVVPQAGRLAVRASVPTSSDPDPRPSTAPSAARLTANAAPILSGHSSVSAVAAASPVATTTAADFRSAPSEATAAPVTVSSELLTAALAPGLNPGAPGDAAPVGLWAVLAWVRREFEQTLNKVFTAPAQQVVATAVSGASAFDPLGLFSWFQNTFFAAPTSPIATTTWAVEASPDVPSRPIDLDGDNRHISTLAYTLGGAATATGNAGGTLNIAGEMASYTPPSSWDGTTTYTDTFTVTSAEAEQGFHIHGLSGLLNMLTFGLLGDSGHTATKTLTVRVLPVGEFVPAPPDGAVTIKGPWDLATVGPYTVQNNGWNLANAYSPDGSTPEQWLSVGGPGNVFTIVHENAYLPAPGQQLGSPLSYPSVFLGCTYGHCSQDYANKTNVGQLSAIDSIPTSVDFNYGNGGGGTYDASYDIWLDTDAAPNTNKPNRMEVMVWFTRQGGVQPVGSLTQAGYTLPGIPDKKWDVWTGQNNGGYTNVVTYIATETLDSYDFDVMDFIDDVIANRNVGLTKDWYLISLQVGYEPWKDVVGLGIDSFSATVNMNPAPPAATANADDDVASNRKCSALRQRDLHAASACGQ